MPADAPFTWIRTKEAAALLGMSVRQLYALVDRSDVPHDRNPLRFDRPRLIEWQTRRLEASVRPPSPPAVAPPPTPRVNTGEKSILDRFRSRRKY